MYIDPITLVLVLAVVVALAGWAGVLFFGFSEAPTWTVIVSFVAMCGGALTFAVALVAALTTA